MREFKYIFVINAFILIVFIQTIITLNTNDETSADQQSNPSSLTHSRHKRDFKGLWGMLGGTEPTPSNDSMTTTTTTTPTTTPTTTTMATTVTTEDDSHKEEEDEEEEEEEEETDDNEEEDEEEGEDEDTEFDTCSPLEVIKNLNYSDFLPNDFEELQNEPMIKIVPRFDDTWGRFQRGFKWEHKLYANKDIKEIFNYLVGVAYELTYDFKLETECAAALGHLFKGILGEQIWAFKFLDAQAHPMVTGFWGGVISSFGEYDQCLDIRSSDPDPDKIINGQYCMLKLLMPYPLVESYDPTFEDNVFGAKVKNFTKKYGFGRYSEINPILKIVEYLNMRKGKFLEFGICIPDKCQPKDIEKEFNRIIYPIFRIPIEINDTTCRVKDEKVHLDHFQKFSVTFFSFTTVMVVLSTAYELYNKFFKQITENDNKNSEQKLNPILVSFSMIANTNKLLTERNGFSSVNTIKLLVCIWFVSAHTYFFTAHSFVLKRFNNSVPLELFYENRYFFVRAKQLGVDTLMVASGLLICHKLIGILEKSSGKFSYVNYIINRWLKLSIPMFAAILLYYLFPLIGSGPIWNDCDGYFQPGCKDWSIILSNFLYYSNFNILQGKYFFGICVHMTWFMASNFQLCLLAPALVITLYRYPKFGITLNILLILSAILLIMSPFILFQINTYYELTRLPSFKALTFSIFAYHMNTLQYVCSFAIGIFAGYAIKNKSEINIPGINQNRLYQFFNIIALNILPVMFAWNNSLNIYNDSPSEYNAVLFFGLGKFFWSASIAWIMYTCSIGKQETLTKILSIDVIQPLTKLSYLMYLVHMPVIFYRIYSVRQTYIMTDWLTLQNIYIDLNVTIVLSYILYILVVKPFENIIRHIFEEKNRSTEAQNENLSQIFASNGRNNITITGNVFSRYNDVEKYNESNNNLDSHL